VELKNQANRVKFLKFVVELLVGVVNELLLFHITGTLGFSFLMSLLDY
jgi:hypothetical protein